MRTTKNKTKTKTKKQNKKKYIYIYCLGKACKTKVRLAMHEPLREARGKKGRGESRELGGGGGGGGKKSYRDIWIHCNATNASNLSS